MIVPIWALWDKFVPKFDIGTNLMHYIRDFIHIGTRNAPIKGVREALCDNQKD